MAPSVEEIAAVCRAHLRDSIVVTDQLMRFESTASESLMARMNDVLGSVVDTNFGAAARDSLRRLYAAIDHLQPALSDTCENLALFYLARSLAVVLEEAVRQREELMVSLAEAECRRTEGYEREESKEYGSEKNCEEYGSQHNEKGGEEHGFLNGEEYGSEKKEEGEEYCSEEKKDEEKEEYGTDGTVEEEQSEVSRCVSPLSSCLLNGNDDDVGRWRRLPVDLAELGEQQRRGVITIHGVSPHIGEQQLASFLEMMGGVADLRLFPKWEGWPTGLAICRYEGEEAARKAVARLHLKVFFGTRLHVRCVVPPAALESSASVADADRPATPADATSPPPPSPLPPAILSPTDTVTVVSQCDTVSNQDSDWSVD